MVPPPLTGGDAGESPARARDGERTRPVRAALFGDDIFLSYARADGSTYAAGLANELAKRGYSCFIDSLGTDAGRDLPESLKRTVRRCTVFVLLATPAARASVAVRKEIVEFQRTRRPIIPISIHGDMASATWYDLVEGIKVERETSAAALEDGNPSPPVIDRIDKSFSYTRRNQRLSRIALGTGGVFLSLLALSLWAGASLRGNLRRLDEATREVRAKTRLAETAEKTARESSAQAAEASRRRDVAQQQAEAAEREREVARRQAEAAQQEREIAEREAAAAQQEADRQTRLALSRRAAMKSLASPKNDAATLVGALSDAVESVRQATAAGAHGLESDQAIRAALAVFPRLHSVQTFPGRIVAGALSNDARTVATMSESGEVEVAPVAGGTRAIVRAEGNVLAVSNGGTTLAVGGKERVRVWGIDAQGVAAVVAEIPFGASRLVLSPDGQRLVLVGEIFSDSSQLNYGAKLWDLRPAKLAQSWDVEAGAFLVSDAAFTSDGTSAGLSLGGNEVQELSPLARPRGQVKLFRNAMGNSTLSPNVELPEPVGLLAVYSPDRFATYRGDRVVVWDRGVGMNYVAGARIPSAMAAESVAFDADGRLKILRRPGAAGAAPAARYLETWDPKGHREVAEQFDDAKIAELGVGNDAAATFLTTYAGGSDYWGANAAWVHVVPPAHHPEDGSMLSPASAQLLFVTPDASSAVFKSADRRELDVFQVAAGTQRTIPFGAGEEVNVVVMSRDERFVATGSGAHATLYELVDGRYSQRRRIATGRKTWRLALDDGGRVLAVTLGGVELWDLVEGRRIDVPELADLPDLREVRLSADGGFLAVVGWRGAPLDVHFRESESHNLGGDTLDVWSVTSKRRIVRLSCPRVLTAIALSPTGRFAAAGCSDGDTHVVRLPGGEVTALPGDGLVRALELSEDESLLAVGSDNGDGPGLLRVFETTDLTEIAQLPEDGGVWGIRFSPDSRFLATLTEREDPWQEDRSHANAVRVWRLGLLDLLAEATDRLSRLERLLPK